MARFKKMLLQPGKYTSPDGEFIATPQRMRGWCNTFKQMKTAGIKVPLPWGHQPDAYPIEDEGSYQLSVSKFNAGYADDLYLDDKNQLWFEGEAPGVEVDENGNLVHWVEHPDGLKRKSAIGEVSAGVSGWRDGKGRYWPDAVVHIALTPLPVWSGQTGFHKLSIGRNGMLRLSTSVDPNNIDWNDLSWADDDDDREMDMDNQSKVQAISQFLSDRLGIEIDADDINELIDKLYSMVDDDDFLNDVQGPGDGGMFDDGVPAGGRVEDQPTLLSARRLGMSEREYYARRLTSRDSGGQRRLSTKRKPRQHDDDYASRLTSK